MKVLISAYACDPTRGSEPGAGWAWTTAAATNHDVWLITRANNSAPIDEKLLGDPSLRITPIYIDLPRWARWWKRGQHGNFLYYPLWQLAALRVARKVHNQEHFDLAHHVTFASDWQLSGIAWVRDLPLIWGPVGGVTGPPWVLWRWLGMRGLVTEFVRSIVTAAFRRSLGDATAKRASLVVAQNYDVARRFGFRRVVTEPNVALAPIDHPRRQVADSRDATKKVAVFVGRLIPWKGIRLAIDALAEPGAEQWDLHVYGAGPDLRAAQRRAKRRGVSRRVQFLGQRPRDDVLAAIAAADALFNPSMHDAAGWAVGEACTVGTPVVALDRGGPSVLVSRAQCGTLVPPEGNVPKALAKALGALLPCLPTERWLTTRLPEMIDQWYVSVAVQANP